MPAAQVAVEWPGAGHGLHDAPQVAVLVLLAHALPHAWYPLLQVNPQAVPSQLAAPLAGVAQGAHAAPQVATLALLTHALPQRW